jgi:hypothetical protein
VLKEFILAKEDTCMKSCLFTALGSTHKVGSNNSVQGLGLENHAGGHGINQHLVDSNIGEVLGHISGDLVPQDQAVSLGIALSNNCKELARALLGSLKGESDDALDTVAGEDGHLGGRLPGATAVGSTTVAGVFTLAVLADDDPVKISDVAVAEGRLGALQHPGRADVGILLERLADGQAKTP